MNNDNQVQIVIKAQDQASAVVTQVQSALNASGAAAQFAQIKVIALGAAIAQLGAVSLSKISQLSQGLIAIKGTVQGALQFNVGGTTPLDIIKQKAEEAIGETAALKDLLSTVGESQIFKTKGIFGAQDSKFVDSISQKFGGVAEKLSASFVKGITEVPIKNIPILQNAFAKQQIPSFVDTLDKSLADVLITQTIGRKLPGVLKGVTQLAFGQDLSNVIAGALKSPQIQGTFGVLFSDSFKEAAKGSAIGAIEKKFAQIVSSGLAVGFTKTDSLVGNLALNFGQIIGKKLIASGSTKGIAKNLFGDDISKRLDQVLPDLSKKLAQASGLAKGVESVAGELALTTAGSIAALGGGGGIGFLLGGAQGAAAGAGFSAGAVDNIMTEVFRAADKSLLNLIPGLSKTFETGLISGLGGAFIKAVKLPQLAELGLSVAIQGTLKKGIELGLVEISQFPTKMGAILQAALPPQLISVFNFVEQLAPGMVGGIRDGIKKALFDELSDSVLKPLLTSPIQKTREEIKRLSAIANNEVAEGYRQQADKLEKEYQARAEQTRQQVKELRTKYTEAGAKALDTNLAPEEMQQAAIDRANAKQGLDKIFAEKRRLLGEVKDLRAKASVADVGEDVRKTAAKQAEAYNQQLEESIKVAEEQITKYNALKERVSKAIPADQEPSEAQLKLISEIDKKLADLQKPFQSPVEKLAQDVAKTFTDLLSGQSDFSRALEKTFNDIDDFTGGALTDLKNIFNDAFGEIAANASKSLGKGIFQGVLNQLSPALEEIDAAILSTVKKIQKIPETLNQPLEIGFKASSFIVGANEPLELFNAIQAGAATAFDAISQVGQQITFFSSGLQTLQGLIANGPFQLLIGQNITLKEQLLATQSSLAATNKVVNSFSGGEITFGGADPAAPIVALQKPVEQAIAKVRQYSLELSGVTSSQLIETFQIISGLAGTININLDQAAQLTKSFAASMGTLGIPLFQARQEVTSILQGQIDQNSVLAKSIGLTNEQVRLWKSQGTIFQNLVSSMKAFESGNKLASRTVGGFVSNIQEIFEEIGRRAGEPLLEPIVGELEKVYNYLNANMGAIAATVSQVAMNLFNGIQAVWKSLTGLFSASQGFLTAAPVYLLNSLANVLQATAKAIDVTVAVLRPAIETFSRLFEVVKPLAGPFLDLAIQMKAMQVAVGGLSSGFGLLANLLPGVGELMFGINMRMLPMLNMFPNLSQTVGTGAAGFLLLGQNMNAIPGLSGMVSSALGPIGPLVAGLAPSIAGFGISVIGVAKMVPFLDNALKGLFASNPGVLAQGFAKIAAQVPFLQPFSGILNNMASQTLVATQGMTIAGIATTRFQEAVALAKIQVRNFIVSTTLMAAGLFAAFYAFDNFILKNKELLDTLGAITEGLQTFVVQLASLATDPRILGIATLVGLIALQMSGLYESAIRLIGVQLASWAMGIATGLDRVAKVLTVVNLAGMAGGASKAAIGLRALGLVMTQGTAAATAFLTANGINAVTLPGLGAAAGGASGGFTALATAVWTAVAGLAALAAPLIIIAAGLAAIGLIRYKKDLQDSTEATEEYGKVTDQAFSQALGVAQKIKKARDEQADKTKNGIKLTEKEYAQNQQLLRQAKNQEVLLNGQIETLKKAQKEAKGDANKNAIQAQIDSLEQAKKTLSNLSTNIQLAPKDLPKLGTIYEQLAQKAATAEEAVNNSAGDPAIFKQKVQELMEVTQAELNAGKITESEARRRLSLITNNTAVEADLQTKAQEAITETYKTEAEKQIQAKSIQQAQIEALSASGEISELEAAKRLTESKNAELKIQLQEAERVHKRRMELLDEEYKKTIANLQAQLNAKIAQADKEPEGSEGRKQKIQEAAAIREQLEAAENAYQTAVTEAERQGGNERAKLQAEQQKNVAEGNKRIQDAQIKEIEKAQKKAIDVASAAENTRLIQQKQLLQRGSISQAEYDEAAAKSTLDKNQKELQSEEQKLAQLEQLLKKAPDKRTRKEIEEQIVASRLRTQELTKSSLDNEQKAYESHLNTIRSAIERDQTKGETQLEKALNSGTKTQADADVFRATQTVQRLEKELKSETRNKDKRLKLELELQQALGKLKEAQTNKALAELDRQFTQANIQLQKGINAGKILEEKANTERANQAVSRLQAEIKLTTNNKDKRLKLELELQQALKAQEEARIAEKLATLKRANLLEQATLQDRVNAGKLTEEALAASKAKAALKSTQEELKLTKQGSTKYAELLLQRSEQVKALREAEIAAKLAILKQGQLKEEIELQKGINTGTVTEEQAATRKVEQALAATEAELKLQQAGSTKALELEKTRLEQIEQLRQSKIAERLANLKRAELREQIELQKGINNGTVLEEQANTRKVQQALAATEAQLQLERAGSTKALELEKTRLEQIEQVRQSQITERLATIKRAQLLEEAAMQEGINNGTILEETAATRRAESELAATQAELNLTRQGTVKYAELLVQRNQKVKALRDAQVAERLAALDKASTIEQIQLQKGINAGTVLEETAGRVQAEQRITRIQAELKIQSNNAARRLQLEKEYQEALKGLQDAQIAERQAANKRAQLVEEIGLQQAINQGLVYEEEANVKKAEMALAATDDELKLTRKGTTKYLELLKQREEQAAALKESKTQARLAALNREQLAEQIGLQNAINQGVIREERANTIRAKQTIDRIKAELALETTNRTKILELRKQLAEAEKGLQDARLAEYKAQLDQQVQAFENRIGKENQALQKQVNLYDMLGKALENQSKLLSARKDLAAAETDYITGSIDLIAQTETSETKKRQLAETTAAIRLKALEQQLAYDRESLALEERKNQLALEREIIQNRLSQSLAEVDIAKAQANIATLNADPKATAEQKQAAQLQLQAELLKRQSLQEEGQTLQERRAIEAELAQNDRRKQAMQQQSQRDKAEFDLINTLPPSKRNQAMQIFREQLAQEKFGISSRQLRQSGVASSRAQLRELLPGFGRRGTPNVSLEAYDPELGALMEVLSPQEAQLAQSDVQGKFDRKFGDATFTVPNAYAPAAPQLQLPTGIGDKLLKAQAEKLTLPAANRGALQTSQVALNRNLEDLNKNITSVTAGDRTYNVTVNFPGRTAQPVSKAEILAGIGRAIQQAERAIA